MHSLLQMTLLTLHAKEMYHRLPRRRNKERHEKMPLNTSVNEKPRVSYMIMDSNLSICIFIIYKAEWRTQHNISILFRNRGNKPILLRRFYLKTDG